MKTYTFAPHNITVGRRYQNIHFPGAVYLGVAQGLPHEHKIVESTKTLVVIEADPDDMVGRIVQPLTEQNTWYWNGFAPESAKVYVGWR